MCIRDRYSVALKMIESLGFLPSIVVASLAPAITRARLENQELYVTRIVNQYRLMFVMFLVTAVPLYFLAQPFMVLFFGEEYRPAGYLLSLFAIRLFFTNMGVAKMSFITNENTQGSEALLIDCKRFADGPVCRIALPHKLCSGTHSCWANGADLRDGLLAAQCAARR